MTVCTDEGRTLFSVKQLLPHRSQTSSSPSLPTTPILHIGKGKRKIRSRVPGAIAEGKQTCNCRGRFKTHIKLINLQMTLTQVETGMLFEHNQADNLLHLQVLPHKPEHCSNTALCFMGLVTFLLTLDDQVHSRFTRYHKK